ncbi:iron uptake transporter permease EfeU [Acidisphaera sp. L21]|uniref:iron uptake transporter permease EfeU n=1 Tax=Acidisphaera sp. L21 TaxID=1641851 RepID=UPI00131D0E93|nr:iron uptake transporter permease EfeU [Acidisphaera sp. L21]
MLIPFLIMLREGIEAALMVGIIASYLGQTGRANMLPMVWAGVLLASVLCLALGIGLDLASAEFPQAQQELFEAVVGVIAVVVLTSMVFWMRKAARSIKAQLHDSVDAALKPGGSGFGLVVMVFLAVGREGLESVFFLLATFQQDVGLAVPAGAILGLLGAVAIGFAIYKGGVKLNLRVFFRWTGVVIVFVAAGLLATAVRSFHEAGLWDGLQAPAFDLSNILPNDSITGTLLAGLLGYNDTPAVGEVLAYLIYLLPALVLFMLPPRRPAMRSAA